MHPVTLGKKATRILVAAGMAVGLCACVQKGPLL